jgi:nucleoside phosphorylase
MIDEKDILILVCHGAEFKAVKKALDNHNISKNIIPLPIGIKAVNKFLTSQKLPQYSVILIGLGGSLSPKYKVGNVLIYENCSYIDKNDKIYTKSCDSTLNNWLKTKLNASFVNGLTVDNLIYSSITKINLSHLSNAEVIDMESYAVMSYFKSVSIIRIISDNYDDNLPDLNSAITPEGKLNNFKMAIAFIKEPQKAVKLIKNALISLKILEKVSQQLRMCRGEWHSPKELRMCRGEWHSPKE